VYAGSFQEFKDLISFVAAKGIKPCIGKIFPLSQGSEAVKLVIEGKTLGKVVLTASGEAL
jgi:D-arabinose 1-dehydrogenase-like Zn-dependent alcohol dehydrogenase